MAKDKKNGKSTEALTEEAAKKLHKRWESWKKALAAERDVKRSTKQKEDEAEAAFTTRIEEPDNVVQGPGSQGRELMDKAKDLERLWQEWQDAKAEGIERRKAAADTTKARAASLERAFEELHQLTLPGVPE